MTKKLWSLAGVTALLLFSCSLPAPQYSVPPPKLNTFTLLVEQDYDTVWTALIDHVSQSAFAIDSFEKDSGLITLAFSGSPSTYADCGDYHVVFLDGDFQGSYVQWLEQRTSVSLSGKMNISVYRMTETVTRIRVNARYVLTSTYEQNDRMRTDTWVFDSGSSASVLVSYWSRDTDRTRMCRPTYQAESDILDAIKLISGNT